MSDLWEEINDTVPNYMKSVCEKYNLKCKKISNYDTALYNSECCWVIKIGKLYSELLFIEFNVDLIDIYDCGRYIASRFDNNDRQNLINVEKAGDNLKNELSVLASGLFTKCEDK